VTGVEGAAHAAGQSRQASSRALDWFVFGVADVQTGFGPFVAVYLTAQAWTQADIGLVLTAGGLISLIGQMPGGALVDALRSARCAASAAVLAIGLSALALALWPIFPVVMVSRVLHAGASCVLGPAIAAISLGLVGHAALGERIGRNARFASIGAGLSAAAMGASGHLLSNQSVFLVTAALVLPTLLALSRIRTHDIVPPAPAVRRAPGIVVAPRALLTNRPLIVFASCILLFHLANAAMLPLMGGVLATQSSDWATVSVAACMIVPQFVVAAFSPWVGRQSVAWGRRPLLLAAFAALAIRGVLFAVVTNPYAVVAAQRLDGVSAAVLGVMLPLIVADATRTSGRFNLALGVVGCAMGIGASLSTTLAGYMVDQLGRGVTFAALAGVAAMGVVVICAALPETRPAAEQVLPSNQHAPDAGLS